MLNPLKYLMCIGHHSLLIRIHGYCLLLLTRLPTRMNSFIATPGEARANSLQQEKGALQPSGRSGAHGWDRLAMVYKFIMFLY